MFGERIQLRISMRIMLTTPDELRTRAYLGNNIECLKMYLIFTNSKSIIKTIRSACLYIRKYSRETGPEKKVCLTDVEV